MALLELSGVAMRFGAVVALNEVSFGVEPDSIVGLIGPNGSGKTTLFNVITGMCPGFEGAVRFQGRDISGLQPFQIKALGVARTFQNIRLLSNMTVLENAMVGMHCLTTTGLAEAVARTRKMRSRETFIREQAYAALEYFGPRLTNNAGKPAYSLSYANRRRLEIARAMVANPKLLLLDEPAAGMNPRESEEVMEMIDQIRGRGMAIIVIEHDMNVIMGISEKIVVLDHGVKIAEGTPHEVRGDQRVLDAYLGAVISDAQG